MASNRMMALLALLAVAGYQNRDRLGEMLGRVTGGAAGGRAPGAPGSDPAPNPPQGGLGGILGGLFGGGAGGSNVSGGLGDLIDAMAGRGHRDVADSWVKTGPNRQVDTSELEDSLGEDTLEKLGQQTGLSREELLARLQAVLPTAVDKMTPEGRLPTESEVSAWAAQR
jgi:uncharacterized protein YidB (DUF937 family)